MRIHYKHKNKCAQLIGNAKYRNDIIDIYLNDKKVPASIEVRFSNKSWNYFTIELDKLFSMKHKKDMLTLILFTAYNNHISKLQSSVS